MGQKKAFILVKVVPKKNNLMVDTEHIPANKAFLPSLILEM